MDKAEKLKHCSGCEDNFYNRNNNLGVLQCWCLDDAKLVLKKQVPIHQVPPWNQKAEKFLSCYHRKGFVNVGPEQTC
jgi:hypothetical protein